MATRALPLASEPIDVVFQNLLESVREVRALISNIDDKSYHLEGKTPSFKNYDVSDFRITLSVKKFGTLIKVNSCLLLLYHLCMIKILSKIPIK